MLQTNKPGTVYNFILIMILTVLSKFVTSHSNEARLFVFFFNFRFGSFIFFTESGLKFNDQKFICICCSWFVHSRLPDVRFWYEQWRILLCYLLWQKKSSPSSLKYHTQSFIDHVFSCDAILVVAIIRSSPPEVLLWKSCWKYAAYLQQNTDAEVWF